MLDMCESQGGTPETYLFDSNQKHPYGNENEHHKIVIGLKLRTEPILPGYRILPHETRTLSYNQEN